MIQQVRWASGNPDRVAFALTKGYPALCTVPMLLQCVGAVEARDDLVGGCCGLVLRGGFGEMK